MDTLLNKRHNVLVKGFKLDNIKLEEINCISKEIRGTICEVWLGTCRRKDQDTRVWKVC